MSKSSSDNYQVAMWEARRLEGQRWQERAARWNVNERRVFISYIGDDRVIADDVRGRLQAREIPSFAFGHDMMPGNDILERIEAEILRSSHIVVVATRESMKRLNWLSYELALGVANQKALLTLVFDPSLDLPDPFRRYRYVHGWGEFERYFDQPEFDPAAIEDFLTDVLCQSAHERARYRPVAGTVTTWERGTPREGGHLTLEGPKESPCLTIREWSAGQMNWEYMLVYDAALRALVVRPVTGFFRDRSLGGGMLWRDQGIVIEYEPERAIAKTRGWRTSNAFWLATVRLMVEEFARTAGEGSRSR